MAGKGEFLLHGLIGGASGAIAALVNMYVNSIIPRSLAFSFDRSVLEPDTAGS
jgi:hypothetical protein